MDKILQKERYAAVKGVLVALSGYITQKFNTRNSSTTMDPYVMSCTSVLPCSEQGLVHSTAWKTNALKSFSHFKILFATSCRK